ncbi:MAG TPA: alpha-glucan family phosphorylase [Burkholderiaceae bacterium]|nr:alpha-glucan family phosphorylase [Burkholderiaceae bacterium]
MNHPLLGEMPAPVALLGDLALDLHWTWSHASDSLWARIDADLWGRTRNPWLILQNISPRRLAALAADAAFCAEYERALRAREDYQRASTWWNETHAQAHPAAAPLTIAYFSMEYGIGEPLPLYSGGLGVLAGDHLKTASDLGVPLVAIGLLYQSGYFRQMLDAHGRQLELHPANVPYNLPIAPVDSADGSRLTVAVELPGRELRLQVWLAQVGRVALYLLDSNDPLNTPADRGITGQLYGGDLETRLAQEVVLGIGGWRALAALGIRPDVCHLNEGHAALVAIERARAFMHAQDVGFWEALWATRAGNVFTTHTPVAAAFDTFPIELLAQYGRDYAAGLGIEARELLALGRPPGGDDDAFNMAYLAARTCIHINGVSRLHGEVSRRIFQPLYPRVPEREVPVGHITNGVHMPSWDSASADTLWTQACGKARWMGCSTAAMSDALQSLGDEALWHSQSVERAELVRYARRRLAAQLGQRGADAQTIARAADVLDPNALTLGFARRFAEYKRPNLLLRDPERLARLLRSGERPVQIIVAGKAHPRDGIGKDLVRQWAEFTRRADVAAQAVFLEDYDIALAQQLVQGVDVWVNTPRRPWEACGTSGMKVLVNGGLNLSSLDGWWAEAYAPDLGWAVGANDGSLADDAAEAELLYRLLEEQVIPEFYARDASGVPRRWIARVRASMAKLAPFFSSNRMLFEYVRDVYLPAAQEYRARAAAGAALARELRQWNHAVRHRWREIHIAAFDAQREGDAWEFRLHLYLGDLPADAVAAQLYAEPLGAEEASVMPMVRVAPIAGALNGFVYGCRVRSARPAAHFTPRVVPHHPHVRWPLELPLVHWHGSS